VTAAEGPRTPVPLQLHPDAAAELLRILMPALRDRVRTAGVPLSARAEAAVIALIHASEQPPTSPERSAITEAATLGSGDVARVLSCSPRWAQYLLRSGRLDAWRVGRTWVTTAAALDAYRFGEAAADDQEDHSNTSGSQRPVPTR